MRRRRSEDSLQFACIGIESEKAENFACSMSAYPKSALILLSALGIRGSFSLQVTCVSFAWHSGARRFFFFFCSYMFSFYCCCCGVRSRDATMERNHTRAFLRLVLNFSWGSSKSGRSNEQKQTRIDERHYTQFLFLLLSLSLFLSPSPQQLLPLHKNLAYLFAPYKWKTRVTKTPLFLSFLDVTFPGYSCLFAILLLPRPHLTRIYSEYTSV